MNVLNLRTRIPEEVRDRLPREASRMRHLFGRLEGVFHSWGYREVITPGFEFLDTVTAGAGAQGKREDLYQFFDRQGRTLALRADMTTPIARLAATKMSGEPLPLRLSYFTPVFRHRGRKAGSVNEIWQAGIELIGAPGAAADAETIAMACDALAATGLLGVKIGLGHVGFVEGILAETGVAPALQDELKEALASRDLVAFEKGVTQAGLPENQVELLLSLATFQGSHPQALERFKGVANRRVVEALEQIGTVLTLLESLGLSERVSLDLGLVRSLGYYTGVVFEGYAPGVGSPILGGGRYDNLLADFGGDLPATGFAFEVDRLLAGLERQNRLGDDPGLDAIVECPPGREAQALDTARQLRAQGLMVEVDLLGRAGDELRKYAQTRDAALLVSPDGANAHRTGENGVRHLYTTSPASIH